MKITFYFLLFIFCGKLAFSSEPLMIWVEFSDKAHSNFSLSRPHEFLSQRAIERRQKQNIPYDSYDLPVSHAYIDSILSDSTISLFYTSKWFNGAMFKAVSEQSLNHIQQFGFVQFIEIAKKSLSVVPHNKGIQSESMLHPFNSPYLFDFQQYGSNLADYGESAEQILMLNGQSLHEEGYWGQSKVIAVLDAGFRNVDTLPAYTDLWNNNQILGYYDFVQAKQELYKGHSHGAYVLSVMGATQPGIFSGTAQKASYWLLRTEDASSEFRIEEYNWLAGAEFADSAGADIINSSLGYTAFDDTLQNYRYFNLDGSSTVTARAANMAFSRGLLVVNSAGNYGTQSWKYIGTPADAHGVLAVGGTDNKRIRASFSSVGPSYDGRVKPQVSAQGLAVAVINNFGSVSRANGTSFSAPLIAGMAASLWSKYPEASNSQIKQAIIRSADRYFSPDSLYGFGIPDFQQASIILEKKIDDDDFLKLINNPLQPESSITFYSFKNENVSISMFNSSGQLVWAKEGLTAYSGFNELKPFYDIGLLTSGIYLIRVNFSDRTETIKAIKF
jgi:hypothetical protein